MHRVENFQQGRKTWKLEEILSYGLLSSRVGHISISNGEFLNGRNLALFGKYHPVIILERRKVPIFLQKNKVRSKSTIVDLETWRIPFVHSKIEKI